MSEIKVNVEAKDNQVIVRTGAAAPLHEPLAMNFTGFLYSPGDYMENKKDALLDATECRLEVDYENMSITFLVNARDKFRDQIIGRLIPSKIIADIGINQEKHYGDKQLGKLLRRNAMYFGDQSAGQSLIHRLMNFEAKITTNIVAKDDLRGNTKKAIEKLIENELPENFVMQLPVFEGSEPQPIKIHLLADTSGTGVTFYLDSPELFILEQTQAKELIDIEIKRFEGFGCAIIRK